ncbi:hypothetical protein Hanom_Chr13g01186121 [Helianthus anomalus]
MSSTRNTVIKQQFEINTFKETVERQQLEITQLRAGNERLKTDNAAREGQLRAGYERMDLEKLESDHIAESSTASGNVVLTSADIALQVYPPVSGEELNEGEFVSELSDEHILALKNENSR